MATLLTALAFAWDNKRVVNEREYRRLRQQIEDDYRRKIDALEIVWKMSADTTNGVSRSDGPIKRGTIDTLVRSVISRMTGTFSPRDVMDEIHRTPDVPVGISRSSVSSALKRLADEDLLYVVEVGKGKRASRYKPNATKLKSQDDVGWGTQGTEPPLARPKDEPEPDGDVS